MNKNINIGSLVKLKISGRAKNTAGTTFSLQDNEIGLIVAKNIWPDASWENRHEHQVIGPFVKILFAEQIAIIPERNLSTQYFEVILEK